MSDVEDLVAEASNELTPADSLARLGRSRNATVRRAVAANPLTPPEALGRLVRDDDQAVLSAVARNPATPAAALWTLARDNAALRGTIAGNASVPPDLLAALVADEDEDVRFWSTFNPHISDEALESLIEDPHSKVRTRAAQALQARREVQRQRDHGRPPRPDAGAEPATAAATTNPGRHCRRRVVGATAGRARRARRYLTRSCRRPGRAAQSRPVGRGPGTPRPPVTSRAQ